MHHTDLIILELEILLRQLTTESYIVGGYVRDMLLGLKSKDIDIVTDAPYDEMSELFKEAGWLVKETGKQYLVLNISKNGNHFEISNFRADTDNTGGIVGTKFTDAMRRDFTINALYMRLGTEIIIDPTQVGLSDIKERTLRFIGKPTTRVEEDPLRVMRFYRLLHTKSLVPHPGSLRAVRKLFKEAHQKVSPERVRSELEKIIGLSNV